MGTVANSTTVVAALNQFSKRFACGKGGLSHDELARVTQLGSDALARSLASLASQQFVTSAVTDEHIRGRRLFYLTQRAIEQFLTPPAN